MIFGLLNKVINFALLSLAEFDHFDIFPGWVELGGAKLRLKTNSAQLKLKLELSLAKSFLLLNSLRGKGHLG